MKKIKKHKFLIILISFLIFFSFNKYVFSSQSDSIDATIKMSVCGDGVIEGPEDCEGTDLDNETCASLGYASGVLVCDSACEFDTSDCIPLADSDSDEDEDSEDTSDDDDDEDEDEDTADTSEVGIIPEVIIRELIVVREKILNIPASLINLDPNNDGKIDVKELYAVVETWVDKWRDYLYVDLNEDCDLNEDKACDLKDFSVLMFYVEN